MKFFKPSGIFFILDMFGEKRPLMHKWIQDLTKISSFNNENSSIFAADELITWGKSLDFLREEKFVNISNKKLTGPNEHENDHRALVWRRHVLAWAGENCKKLDGSFCEFGCYDAAAADFLNEYCDLEKERIDFYLYDTFDPPPKSEAFPKHSDKLYDEVTQRFEGLSNIKIIKGELPESLINNHPDKISFAHIDLNNAEAEMGVLKFIYEKVVEGGIILFDDYGWISYKEQMLKEKKFLEDKGHKILELPTGQGLLIKR
tara:strand:+ start:189 stop:968 length:780 start_codon:yes stop_codon:yes gene_type:complete